MHITDNVEQFRRLGEEPVGEICYCIEKLKFHEMRKIEMKKPSIKNIVIILLIVLVLFGIYCFAHFAYVASAM